MKRALGLLFVVILPLGLVGPGAGAETPPAGSTGRHLSVATGGGDGTVGVAAARAMRQGYLVPDQAAYDRAKAAAADNLGLRPSQATPSVAAPVSTVTFKGLANPGLTPSDSTGAMARPGISRR